MKVYFYLKTRIKNLIFGYMKKYEHLISKNFKTYKKNAIKTFLLSKCCCMMTAESFSQAVHPTRLSPSNIHWLKQVQSLIRNVITKDFSNFPSFPPHNIIIPLCFFQSVISKIL